MIFKSIQIKWILAICVSCVIAELLLRAIILSPTSTHPDNELGWTYIPKSTILKSDEGYASNTLNNLGLNDEILNQTSTSAKRILLLGDSYTESLQISRVRNFSELIEKRSCTDIVNAGRSDMTVFHYNIAAKRLIDYQFDQAIIVISPGDIIDIRNASYTLSRNIRTNEIESINVPPYLLSPMRRFFSPALEHSSLLTYAKNRLKILQSSTQPIKKNKNDEKKPVSIFLSLEEKNEFSEIIQFTIRDIHKHIPASILFIPSYHYHPRGIAIEKNSSIEVKRYISSLAQEEGIPFIAVTGLDAFYKKHSQPPIGFSNAKITGGHLNQHGHKIVANSLFSLIGNYCVQSENKK